MVRRDQRRAILGVKRSGRVDTSLSSLTDLVTVLLLAVGQVTIPQMPILVPHGGGRVINDRSTVCRSKR